MLRAGHIGPSALFRPAIISSHTPLMECDLFGHKSNSTYFSDLDMSRLHLVMLVFFDAGEHARPARMDTSPNAPPLGKPGIHLGGVSCIFRREIKPYKKYDILTRVLSWDEKWIYVVSHIVKKGAIKPKTYLLQPNGPSRGWWPFSLLRGGRGRRQEGGRLVTDPKQPNGTATASSTPTAAAAEAAPHSAIYASSIAKYVVKRGRVTVPPERVLQLAGLLPPKDNNNNNNNNNNNPSLPSDSSDDKKAQNLETNEDQEEKIPNNNNIEPTLEEKEEAILNATLLPKEDGSSTATEESDEEWDWSRIEAERQRGLHLASLIKGMDNLHGELTGDNGIVLGHYSDIF